MDLIKKLDNLKKQAFQDIKSAKTVQVLNDLKIKYLGRKSELTDILKSISSASIKDRPVLGKKTNEIKKQLNEMLEEKLIQVSKKKSKDSDEFDLTLPGNPFLRGNLHPVTKVLNEIKNIFFKIGFDLEVGPEIETDYYNFTALNFPEDHPARDAQDTFFLNMEKIDSSKPFLLRTHTSPVQIRFMELNTPPFRIIIPGKVYRCDSDISHIPMFHQIEGLAVSENISFSDLKGVLDYFVHSMFGKKTRLRFRPSFFPFTEPSVEIDISCVICKGSGCRVCSDTGWLEILGAGMVHRNVFKSVNYDNEKYTGFAFGLGIERIAMLKYGIDDIRLFYQNDIRFLKQFV